MNDINMPIIYEMELPISYSVCAPIPKESVLWRKAVENREGAENTERVEKLGSIEAMCPDDVHMQLELPPKLSASSFTGYLKGKAAE